MQPQEGIGCAAQKGPLVKSKGTTDVSKRWKEASTVFPVHDEAVRVMTVRQRYPFVALGVPLVLLLLFAFGPTVILLTGGMVADALGCAMPIDAAAGPCPFMGVDLATFLAVAVAFGYLAFFTFPTGTTLLGVWLLAAVIVTLVWWLRRWRASSNG